MTIRRPRPLLLAASILSLAFSLGRCGVATAQSVPSADALALVRRTAVNEERANHEKAGNSPNPIRFKLHKEDEKGITTKEIVQTRDGSVARLVAIDNRPLNSEEEAAEAARLQRLIDQPELQERRLKREKEDADRANKMVQVMPDAFLYSYGGIVQGPNGPAVRLTFKPNPAFAPPDQESRVAVGIEGEVWIDQAQERLVRLDAHLFQDVDFGWGIVGRLYKGGSILIENADVGNHTWAMVHMKLNLTGKALMIKTLSFRITEDASDFQAVPKEMSYKEAIHMLRTREDAASQVAGK